MGPFRGKGPLGPFGPINNIFGKCITANRYNGPMDTVTAQLQYISMVAVQYIKGQRALSHGSCTRSKLRH